MISTSALRGVPHLIVWVIMVDDASLPIRFCSSNFTPDGFGGTGIGVCRVGFAVAPGFSVGVGDPDVAAGLGLSVCAGEAAVIAA